MIVITINCLHCGYITNTKLPIVSKENEGLIHCGQCHKIIAVIFDEENE